MGFLKRRTPDTLVAPETVVEADREKLVRSIRAKYNKRDGNEFEAGRIRMLCGAGMMRFFVETSQQPFMELRFHKTRDEITNATNSEAEETEEPASPRALELAMELLERKPAA